MREVKTYYKDGVMIPKEIYDAIINEKLKINMFATLKNAEQRMLFVKYYGVERMKIKGILIDTYDSKVGGHYELYDMHVIFDNETYVPYLFMINPSTKMIESAGMPPTVKTCKEALGIARNGEVEPDILT